MAKITTAKQAEIFLIKNPGVVLQVQRGNQEPFGVSFKGGLRYHVLDIKAKKISTDEPLMGMKEEFLKAKKFKVFKVAPLTLEEVVARFGSYAGPLKELLAFVKIKGEKAPKAKKGKAKPAKAKK